SIQREAPKLPQKRNPRNKERINYNLESLSKKSVSINSINNNSNNSRKRNPRNKERINYNIESLSEKSTLPSAPKESFGSGLGLSPYLFEQTR
ncbi:2395_t:CDS:2, partial [Dentiscutata heterogama]